MHDDRTDEVPGWILPFFTERTPDELRAWWEAVKRLYGPLGVRMDFRAVPQVADPVDVQLLAG